MEHRTKSSIFLLVIALVAVVATLLVLQGVNKYYRQSDSLAGVDVGTNEQTTLKGWQTFKNANLEFQYPSNLAVKEEGGQVVLNHNVPYENHGDCDMKGDEKTYPTLDDFNVTIQVANGNVAQAVKKLSPYMPAENFTKDSLKINPGFIDEYQVGDWTGFMIYEGAEGCGHMVYYFPITSEQALVVEKDLVQILSGIFSDMREKDLLKVPGVISREESDKLFRQIMETLKVDNRTNRTDETDMADWKTYRNEEYGFEFKYPDYLGDFKAYSGKDLYRNHIGFLESLRGSIGVALWNRQFDSNKIEGIYGYIENPRKLSFNNKDWYLYMDGDAGCGGTVAHTELETKVFEVQFSSCEGDNPPFIGEDNEFINQIISTFRFFEPVSSGGPNTTIVGGDRDEHGCIGSAGYSWCEVKNKCLRVWEEKCE